MARALSAKRPRALTEDRGISSGDASHQSRGKRPRNSSPQDDVRESSEAAESRHTDNESASQDGNDEAEEAAYMRATQHVTKHLQDSENRQNLPAEAGIIEEVRCTNFMCHEQLTVTLGPLINFITGHNGSGKSAVLTAVTLCLGGKATATNRGQNLKSFIKEGRDYCVLSVKLKNQGSSAFKHDQYGDSIIVERHFGKSGSPHFKIKDQNGKIVSQKKAELEDIVDAFALQVDNPMNVLTQDMARQFLNDSNAKDKYKFFLQGTQLETLNRDYIQISHELEEQEAKAETLQGDLEVYRKKAEVAVNKAKAARNLQNMRAKERVLAHQAAWAHVQAHEQTLSEWESEVERATQDIAEKTAQADEQSVLYSRADQTSQNVKQEITDKQAEVDPIEHELEEFRAQFNNGKTALFKAKGQIRLTAEKIKAKESLIRKKESEIQEHRQRQAEADNGLYAAKLQELADAKEVLEQAKQERTNHDDKRPVLQNEFKAVQQAKQPTMNELAQKRDEIAKSRANIRAMEQGQRKWIDSYPQPAVLERLLRAIENENGFREPPVGPLGHYIELKRPDWSPILEKAFGAALNGFVVTSKADQALLSGMMKRLNYHVPVYIGRNDRIDTTQHEPAADLDTWMRVLKINNNLVRNQLIVAHSIEQIVLIKDRDTGYNLMKEGGERRRNVRMCFTMMASNPRKGHIIQMSEQSGSLSIGPLDEYRGLSRMQADKAQGIQYEKENLAQLQREYRAIEERGRTLQDTLNACQANIQKHGVEDKQLQLKFQQAQEDADRLEIELTEATPDAAAIEQLEQDVASAREDIKFEEGQYQDAIIEADKLNDEQRGTKVNMDDAESRLKEIKAHVAKLNAKAKTLADRREQALRSKNAALEAVSGTEKVRSQWEEKVEKKRDDVQEFVRQAESISPRVEVPRGATFDSLNAKLLKLQKTREESEKELGGSEDELVRLANQAKETHKQAREQLLSVERLRLYLKKSLDNRQKRWLRFRQDISLRARVTFNYLLSERQFRGSLNIDHKSKQLEIHVQPDITVASNAGRQTKTLSGGEKSFSTICLLLALWDAMGSPIRCLDEFDVFMDNVNREISMRMMVQAARRAIGRQYILISPQAMGNLPRMDDVTIIRMQDPERGQSTLNFERGR